MSEEQPLSELLAAEAHARTTTGWDLSFIDMRQLGDPIPWNYEQLAREALTGASRAVDLGTGGGEVLVRIVEGRPGRVVATEQWGPNAHLAYARLREHHVPLVWCEAESKRLPFRDGIFNLVLDRHEALDPSEVDRILAPGGWLLTQQVSSRSWPELHRYFEGVTRYPDHDHEYPLAFEALGYELDIRRHDFEVAFASLSELVQMLVVAPWTVPGFTVESHLEGLRRLEHDLDTPAGIVMKDGRYLLRAKKPG